MRTNLFDRYHAARENAAVILERIGGKAMKLDMGLVREILLYVETNAKRAHSDLEEIEIDGHSAEEVAYHICLMTAKGFMTASVGNAPDDDDEDISHIWYSVHGLTWDGHELLEIVRQKTTLDRLRKAAGKVGEASIEVFFAAAKADLQARIMAALAGIGG